MLNISKYHRAIMGCSAIATASLTGLVQAANAVEQFTAQNVRTDRGTILIAQTNQSQAGGSNVSNTTGSNVSNTTGTNVSNGTGSNGTGSNGTGGTGKSGFNGGKGFDSGTIARAGAVQTRLSNAISAYDRAAAALAALETNQPNASDSGPVRYAREVASADDCGCPNADVVGGGSKPPSKELLAAKEAEAAAAAELAAAQAEARAVIQEAKNSNTSSSQVSYQIW